MRVKTAIGRSAAVLLCLVVVGACGGTDDGAAGDGSEPVRFALISIQTPGIDLLPLMEAGAQAAATKINNEGDFGGREVVIDVCNSQADTSVAVTCAYQTLENDPVAMFGCEVQWSATGLPVYAQEQIPSVNCMNTAEDFSHEWSFGITTGAFGEHRGVANYLCTRDDVENVVTFAHDIPQQRRDIPAAVAPILEGCGKQVQHEWFPSSAADLTPHVAGVVEQEPDFVLTQVGGPQAVQLMTSFQEAGFPADRISIPSNAASFGQLDAAGAAAHGVYTAYETASWSDTDNPDVAEYLQAMEGSEVDARHAMPMMGYSAMMWFYTVAEQVGFDEFDSASLTEFMRNETGVDIPLSREFTTGPADFPQVRQPYVQVLQWRDGQLNPVEIDGRDDSWISGFEPLATG